MVIYQPLIDFNAPILPGVGLGSIKLEQPLLSLNDWLLYNFFSINIDDVTVQAFHGIFVQYSVAEKVEIVVNVIEGCIEHICCLIGYEGTFDNIKPGDTLYDLLKQRSDAYINNGFIYFKNTPGIKIDYPESFEDYEDVREFPDFIIERIYVVR